MAPNYASFNKLTEDIGMLRALTQRYPGETLTKEEMVERLHLLRSTAPLRKAISGLGSQIEIETEPPF